MPLFSSVVVFLSEVLPGPWAVSQEMARVTGCPLSYLLERGQAIKALDSASACIESFDHFWK